MQRKDPSSHFTRQKLCDVLTRPHRPMEPPERERALAHFGQGCRRCWRSLDDLAALEPCPDTGDDPPGSAPQPSGALVAQALRRCHGYLSARSRQARRRYGIDLRPTHRYALIRACMEEDDVERALAFRRLVLEESRDLVLRDPTQSIMRIASTMQELRDPELARQSGFDSPMKAQEALALAYLADDYRTSGDLEAAQNQLAAAMKLLDATPCDAETYATCYELGADLARSKEDRGAAITALHLAEKMLERCPVPGRRAVTRLRLGLAWSHFGNAEGAVRELRSALHDLPPEHFPRLRLQVIHHMAAAEVRCRRFEDARRSLEVAERLYKEYGTDQVQAERAWLQGVVAFEAGAFEVAERLLWTSLTLFETQGRVVDATQALMDLGRVYKSTGEHEKLAQATMRFLALSRRPEVRGLSQETRQRILEGALHCGFKLEALAEYPDLAVMPEADDSEEIVN